MLRFSAENNVGHRSISVQTITGVEIQGYGRPSGPSTKWPTVC